MRNSTWLIPVVALGLTVPFASAGEGDGNAETGKTLFDSKCVICHNADSADKKIGPGLKGVKDGKLPSGKDATYENLLENLNKGGGMMPAFEKTLTAEEKDHIIAYVLTL